MSEKQQEKRIELVLDGNIMPASEGIRINAILEMGAKGRIVDVYLKSDFLKVFDKNETRLEKIFKRNKFTIETIVNDKFYKLGEPSSLEMRANDTGNYIL
jgi:hypothetical protein